MKNKQKFKSNKIIVPVNAPRNPTVVPMLETTKPGRHRNKKRKSNPNEYYEY